MPAADGTGAAAATSPGMLRALLLLATSVAASLAAADDQVGAVAKNDVEVALLVDRDHATAHAIARNRNPYAVAAAFTVSFSIGGEPQRFRLVLPPKGEAGRDGGFALVGDAALAEIRIQGVDKIAISEVPGTIAGETRKLDGVTVESFTHPSAPGYVYLAFTNANHDRVQVDYAWYLDGDPRVLTQPVPGRGSAGRSGEIALVARPPEAGEEPPHRAFDLKAVRKGP